MTTRRPQTLLEEVRRSRPDIADPLEAIRSGHVLINGIAVTNPASLVRPGSSMVLRRTVPLRGEAKLKAALLAFGVPVRGRVALDIGAATGGFTRALLAAGARRVYAVDAGVGQLLGSLRQDPSVVNLEGTNIADLSRTLVPEPVEVITIDVSYLSLASAVHQLGVITLASGADLVGLVKPMFELRLKAAPADQSSLDEALARAGAGIAAAGWKVLASIDSPMRGARGAREMLIHARR